MGNIGRVSYGTTSLAARKKKTGPRLHFTDKGHAVNTKLMLAVMILTVGDFLTNRQAMKVN